MSNMHILRDELIAIQQEQRSGRLVVYGRSPGDADKLLNAQLYFNQGHLVQATLGHAKEAEAMSHVLALEPERVVFLKTAGERVSESAILPSTGDLITQIKGAATATNTAEIIAETITALASVFGNNAQAEAEAAAAKNAPATDPVAFLRACEERVELIFGKGIATPLFEPLYKKVRG